MGDPLGDEESVAEENLDVEVDSDGHVSDADTESSVQRRGGKKMTATPKVRYMLRNTPSRARRTGGVLVIATTSG
jgi:hypothetical protein